MLQVIYALSRTVWFGVRINLFWRAFRITRLKLVGMALYLRKILRYVYSTCPGQLPPYDYIDIALMSMYMTDTFCSCTRNVIFKSCFLLSLFGSIVKQRKCLSGSQLTACSTHEELSYASHLLQFLHLGSWGLLALKQLLADLLQLPLSLLLLLPGDPGLHLSPSPPAGLAVSSRSRTRDMIWIVEDRYAFIIM